jgi:carbamoylphosphate synthase small subunit
LQIEENPSKESVNVVGNGVKQECCKQKKNWTEDANAIENRAELWCCKKTTKWTEDIDARKLLLHLKNNGIMKIWRPPTYTQRSKKQRARKYKRRVY